MSTLNKYSCKITQQINQGHSQAMLYATGMTEEDMLKPQVGIASVWYDGNPCNMHLRDFSDRVKEGVDAVGMLGMRFNTIGVSDGISMGTDGMSFSLPSRDIIADSIETIMGAQFYDALICLPGCDKNMPGCLIAMGRLNRPAIMVYGGTIKPGHTPSGKTVNIVSALECYGSYIAGKIDDDERRDIIKYSCPGPGACGGMYTANTMSAAIEALGMSLPYSSSTPAVDQEKLNECFRVGAALRLVLELDIKPRDIMSREAFENAMVLVMAIGGSTNAVLHLIAMARSVEVDIGIDDFQAVSNRIPLLADLKPSGKYYEEDLHKVGGTPGIMKMLLEKGVLNGDCLTVTGKSLAENLESCVPLNKGQNVVFSWDKPLKKTSHIQILRGNLSPQGAVAKITGKEGEKFRGKAQVFDSEEGMIKAIENNKIVKGSVVVIRYEGPKGGPGMPEMLQPTALIMGCGLGKDVALITDGRFSGGSHGFIVGHITPEAQEGGPIALVVDGDTIMIDAERNELKLCVDDGELSRRRAAWKAPDYKVKQGVLYKYIKSVHSASEGCVTD